LIDWTVKYATPLLGLTGAALFGVLRLAYLYFYLRLRATPEEVGYGYLEILSGQLIGTAELVLLLTVLLLAAVLAARAVRHAAAGRWHAAVSRPRPRTVVRLARRCALAALAVVLTCLPMLAWIFGTEARHGYAVRNIYLAHTLRIPVLAVQASPATVIWTGPTRPDMSDLSRRRCLLYLGKAGGVTVFYDVTTQESLHVPTAQIMLTIQNIKSVPADCS
jgi:hypothetical protein